MHVPPFVGAGWFKGVKQSLKCYENALSYHLKVMWCSRYHKADACEQNISE